jgi:hypothetical protein
LKGVRTKNTPIETTHPVSIRLQAVTVFGDAQAKNDTSVIPNFWAAYGVLPLFSGWATTRTRRCQKIARVTWPPVPDPGDCVHCHQRIEHCYWSWAPTRGKPVRRILPRWISTQTCVRKSYSGHHRTLRAQLTQHATRHSDAGSSNQRAYKPVCLVDALHAFKSVFKKRYGFHAQQKFAFIAGHYCRSSPSALLEHESSRGEERTLLRTPL